MTKQSLIDACLTEEQAGKVMKLEGVEYVSKGKFDEVNSELQAVQKTVKERDKQLETLKKSAGDSAGTLPVWISHKLKKLSASHGQSMD